MKKYISIAVLMMVLAIPARASTIQDYFNNFSGQYFLSGLLYSVNPDPITGLAQGIGTVNEIRDGGGNLLWSSGQLGSWINYVYNDYYINYRGSADPFTGAYTYTETLGKVDFYTSTSNIFSATGNWVTDSNNIINNSLAAFASLQGSLRTVNNLSFSVYGTVSESNVDGHGALDIIGGTHGANFDTTSIPFMSLFSDMSFDFAGTNINTSGYAYSGTASAKGLIQPVTIPEPASLFLLGIGFIGFAVFARRKSDNQCFSSSLAV